MREEGALATLEDPMNKMPGLFSRDCSSSGLYLYPTIKFVYDLYNQNKTEKEKKNIEITLTFYHLKTIRIFDRYAECSY